MAVGTDLVLKAMKERKKKEAKKLYVSPENKKRLAELDREMKEQEKIFIKKYDEILEDVKKETKERNGKEK